MLHARQMVAEHMEKAEDTPAANQPIIDPEAVIREHMRRLGAKGGKVSGAKRMENLSDDKRREIASQAARKRWADVAKRKAAKKR